MSKPKADPKNRCRKCKSYNTEKKEYKNSIIYTCLDCGVNNLHIKKKKRKK